MPDQPCASFFEFSLRARRGSCFFLLLGTIACPWTRAQAQRPKIVGISSAQILVTDYCKSIDFYAAVLGRPHDGQNDCPVLSQEKKYFATAFRFQPGQQLNLGSFGPPNPYKLVSEFGFETDDLPALLQYLKSRGVDTQPAGKFPMITITVQDPEGHRIAFTQRGRNSEHANRPAPGNDPQRIIHVGFAVWNQPAMDKFYKDILGFRPYWHGGMKDGTDDWVDLQVPDGTDWIEYMLNVPLDAGKQTLGVMNHIALGVADIPAAAKQLQTKGMQLTEAPKIGRGGKWLLNLYDPDGTRVELMEFTPTQKPCCSDYTGPHPGQHP
jgi:catechol 2,3-dioxygenase-like lactoylglutathione lyase family enzyme